ncbi:MAG TPA: hypothetical protein VG839_02630 [Asticcacaulis sp.]|nr:hypothetical protein [Asticcacaulis sp.]
MAGIVKGFAAALVALAVTAGHAGALTVPPPPVLPEPNSEAWALFQWPQLAQRDGNHLLVMNHGGGKFSNKAAVLTDGVGECQTYRFAGALRLFDAHTRRLEPVAELLCLTAEGSQHALVRDDGSLLTGRKLTASADGHYVFIEARHRWSEDDSGKPIDLGQVAEIEKWTYGGGGGGGPFKVVCRQSRPDGPADFRALCTDPKTGQSFDARFAATDPAKPDNGYKAWRLYNLSTPSDDKRYYMTDSIIISFSNASDPFVAAAAEAKAIAAHPGLVRRDGPELVLLDKGHESRRLRDDGCEYWYFGRSAALYDARTGTKSPVAEIDCRQGEFSLTALAPPYAPPQFAYQHYAVSDDGKTLIIGYGSTDIIDWQSRKVLLNYPHRCDSMTVRGSDHFSARCETDNGPDGKLTVDFDRDGGGTWAVTERPKN